MLSTKRCITQSPNILFVTTGAAVPDYPEAARRPTFSESDSAAGVMQLHLIEITSCDITD